MTNERARTELEQLYMSLSEEKKKALDVAFKAMEQSMPTMVYPQVDGITPTVVAQADGEKTCGTCRNEDTYHCAECENKSDYEQSQADGEYILKKDVMGCIGQTSLHSELARKLRKLPSVAILPEHDGCKDCVYQDNPQDAMPCRECKQNYMDKWKAIPSAEPKTGHWEWVQYDSNPNIGNWHCSECRTIIPHMPEETDNTPIYKWCPICGARMD